MIEERFRDRSRIVEIYVCEVQSDGLPSAGGRRRSSPASWNAGSAGDDDGPIHIVGHSTGGLDARLVSCADGGRLPGNAHRRLGWTSRLARSRHHHQHAFISAPRLPPSSPR